VDPDGNERTAPADLSRTTCRFIVNALNRTPGHEGNSYPGHPLPWAVNSWDEGRRFGIVDANDQGDDSLETCVASAGSGLTREDAELFVNAVNQFYQGE